MRPERPTRAETPLILALRDLKEHQPDLAVAADLQIELAQVTRRLSARAPLPALASHADRQGRLAAGRHVIAYADFRFDWSDVRLAIREVCRALVAVGALGSDDAARAGELVRGETAALERSLESWFNGGGAAGEGNLSDGLRELLDTAMRPFMARAAAAAMTGLELATWQRPVCPACGAEPDMALIARDGQRHLCCHRCRTQWPWHAWACPRCENADRAAISSFASRDGLYRIYACGRCQRYIKAFDCRSAPRAFFPEVDLIATLPLDAAAVQKGFSA